MARETHDLRYISHVKPYYGAEGYLPHSQVAIGMISSRSSRLLKSESIQMAHEASSSRFPILLEHVAIGPCLGFGHTVL